VKQGFPIVSTPPSLSKGPALYALKGVTPDYRHAQVQQFNVSAQRELSKELVLTVGFVGSAGAHLSWAPNINLPLSGPGAVDPRRPYAAILPAVTSITWIESAGNSFFSSMQVNLEKRLSHGLYLLTSWTWSHGLDNSLSDGSRTNPVIGPSPIPGRSRSTNGSTRAPLRFRRRIRGEHWRATA
jgi:hypothetical protein